MIAALVFAVTIGVASGNCAGFNEEVPLGTKVTLLDASGRKVGTARTVAPDERCRDSELVTFHVGLSEPLDKIGFAVIGSRRGLRFDLCATYEGLQMSAWRRRERVFHEYVYLGYDVDPTCPGLEPLQ